MDEYPWAARRRVHALVEPTGALIARDPEQKVWRIAVAAIDATVAAVKSAKPVRFRDPRYGGCILSGSDRRWRRRMCNGFAGVRQQLAAAPGPHPHSIAAT